MVKFTLQDVFFWMEQGGGAKLFQGVALALGIMVLSGYLVHKRFTGLPDEYVAEQAVYAKSIAQGDGFSTSVIWPQTIALLDKRVEGYVFRDADVVPEVHLAPLYPIVLAGALKTVEWLQPEWIWQDPVTENPAEYPGFNADWVVLGANVLLFWLALLLVYFLTRLLFSARTALIALGAMALSVGLWDEVIHGTGVALLHVLVPLLFIFWVLLERHLVKASEEKRIAGPHWLSAVGIPVMIGLCWLTEYATLPLLVVYMVYLALRCRGLALGAHLVLGLVLFSAVTGWWIARNVELTGSPVALAWQEIPLKMDDPTAMPETFKRALSIEPPEVSIRKIGHKAFKQLEENVKYRLWSSGGYVFMAFFIAGMMYHFRSRPANNMRWLVCLAYAAVVLLQPMLDSGASQRLPAYYLCPLIIVFGAAFFTILLESTASGQWLKQAGIIVLLMGVQAAPMLHNLAAPPLGARFTYPPYLPRFMSYTRTMLSERFVGDYGVMSDIPAGLAWYSQQPVWAQPTEYEDFVELTLYQNIGALYLSPEVLSQPYFSKLTSSDLDVGEDVRTQQYWGAIYSSLQSREVPTFFPLKIVHQLYSDMYVLENPLATNRRPGTRNSRQ